MNWAWLGRRRRHLVAEPPAPAEPPTPETTELEERIQKLENFCYLLAPDIIQSDRGGVVINSTGGSSAVSLDRINEFVDGLLQNRATNMGWLPDALERRIDRRIMQLALGAICQTLDTTTLELTRGHKLTLSLRPSEGKQVAEAPVDEEEPSDPTDLDAIVFRALEAFLATVKVGVAGHDLEFHLSVKE